MKVKSKNEKCLELIPETQEEAEELKMLYKSMVWEEGDIIKLGEKRYVVVKVKNGAKTELTLEAVTK